MEDKPRYSRYTDLLKLVVKMSSRLDGVSLQEIQDEFHVGRRTAERMRDCVMVALRQVEEIPTSDRCKRWGFARCSLSEFVSFSPEDIAILEKLKLVCDEVASGELEEIIDKLKVLNRKKLPLVSDTVELLLKSEGYAISQTQNYKVDLEVISNIRLAIKEKRKLALTYHDKERKLIPLGLIYGEKVFLIAKEEAKGDEIFQYVLHRMKDVKVLYEWFEDQDFNLQEYAKKSFGVYQGEVYDVKLRFIPEAAEDVLNYHFHPTQKMKVQDDGSVVVTFKASGNKHIMWNLFKWGYAVEILAPAKLKKEYKNYIDEIRKKL